MIIEEIVKSIKNDIAQGKIRPKQRLPSEKQLQDLFGVGRGTIREAIKILEGMGLVWVKKGRNGGVFLTDNSGQLAWGSLSSIFQLEESKVLAFIEFRRTVEPKMVFLAAQKRTDNNIAELKEALDLFETEIRTRELYVTATEKFLRSLVEATQNSFLIFYYRQILDVLNETSKLIFEVPNGADLSFHFFTQIYDAVKSGDPAKGEMIADAYLVQIENSARNAKNFGIKLGHKSNTIKWGVMLDLTGSTYDWAKQFALGMMDSVRFINESGGINGKKIEMVVHDDKYQLSEGQVAYKRFRDNEKVLGIYIQSTGTTLALASQANKDKMFMFTGSTTGKLANPAKYPFHFSLCTTYSDLARIGIKYICDTWKDLKRPPRMVFMFPDNTYGRDMLIAGHKYAVELGVELGPDLIVNWPTMDATPQLLTLKEYDADYALVASTAMNAATILKDARRLGLRTQFVCNNRVFTEALPKQSLGAAEGVLGLQPVVPFGSDVPGMESIVACHNKWHPYHDPTLAYVEGWLNLLVPMEACKRADEAGQLTSEGLISVLESFRDFEVGGLVPPLSYYSHDHRASTATKIYCIQKGELVSITGLLDIGRDREYFEL